MPTAQYCRSATSGGQNVCNPFNHPHAFDKAPGNTTSDFQRLLGEHRPYSTHRAAIAHLRELDNSALRDIGLTHSQIDAAVHGFMTDPERARI
ncbi:DUF1127 domain-containing protein [Phyllobacterium sp. P5_D12]